MDGSRLGSRVGHLHARLYRMTYQMVCRALPAGAPKHTMTLLLLAVLGALNLLSVAQVLWLLGAIPDPYQPSALSAGHGWVWSAVILSIYANLLLGRRSFRALESGPLPREQEEWPAETYFLVSLVTYMLTFYLPGSLPG